VHEAKIAEELKLKKMALDKEEHEQRAKAATDKAHASQVAAEKLNREIAEEKAGEEAK
jgi:hypothetical protein